jgi:hypothetical protein
VISCIKALKTGSGAFYVETDCGRAYIKTLGNPEGPYILACEWIGTRVADLLGLPTFDHALIEITKDDDFLVFAKHKNTAEPGTAFATREEQGTEWAKDKRLLSRIENQKDISNLVIVDTLLRNPDRYGPNGSPINLSNVFFSSEADAPNVVLKAFDFSHCITNGRDLSKSVSHIGNVKDEKIYGLFPEFQSMLNRETVVDLCKRISELEKTDFERIVNSIPSDWKVKDDVKTEISNFLYNRSDFLVNSIEATLFPRKATQAELLK